MPRMTGDAQRFLRSGIAFLFGPEPGVILLALAAGLVAPHALSRVLSPGLYLHIVQPALWLALGALTLWLWKRDAALSLPRFNGVVVLAALLFAILQLALLFALGIMMGFGQSPYARSLSGIALNLWSLAAAVAGGEIVRAYLVQSMERLGSWAGPTAGFVTLLALALPLGVWTELFGGSNVLPTVGGVLTPAVAESAAATYLSMLGGPAAAITFRMLLGAFERLSPILPNLPWLFSAFGAIVSLLLILTGAQGLCRYLSPSTAEWQPKAPQERGDAGWLVIAVIGVALFWFTQGLFGVRPALTSGVSMEPLMHTGDLAFTVPIKPDDVRVGDVIRFRYENMAALHRVLAIQEENGQRLFITKGDNNEMLDEPVQDAQIEGRLVLIVHKLGLPAVWFSQLLHSVS